MARILAAGGLPGKYAGPLRSVHPKDTSPDAEAWQTRAMIRLWLGLFIVLLGGCSRFDPATSRGDPDVTALRYVALGDSYTIGTSVATADRWPNQLVERLDSGTRSVRLIDNLAVNGFTSADVIERELPHLDELRPEFVSLLVGVNDVVQGVPAATFETNAAALLDALLARVPADRIVVVSTPDYTVTPEGASFGDPAIQSAGIARNNAILAALAGVRGIAFVDIYDLSLRAADDPSLTADDGLHPSGAQYALWVERVAPVVVTLLRRPDATAD